MKKFSIGVLGAGTWGMALARMLTVSGNDVQVWSAIEAEVDNLSTTRVHPNLPGMVIPQELRFTKSIEEVCTGKDVLLFAVPSVFVRATAAKARPYIRSGQIIVDVAKGIEPDTLYTMTEILADELSHENGPPRGTSGGAQRPHPRRGGGAGSAHHHRFRQPGSGGCRGGAGGVQQHLYARVHQH